MVKIDEKLSYLKQRILHMATIINNMYAKVYEALDEHNVDKALEVIKMDEFVNRLDEEVNDLAIENLALLALVASDLRKVIAAIKITTDLERIGDYAKNIASFVITDGYINEDIKDDVKIMIDNFLTMLDHAMDCYNKEDLKWAYEIPLEDENINAAFKSIVDKVKTDENVDHVIAMSSMLRNIERAGDHTKNVCEHIIYQLKGLHIEFN
ncbi:MAG: phosphate signaling complex protein PhoU [Erysipelotrichaceae bacterium]|nr:phosphate signaling complex protein PhoU [Erysipelotrichaceae bacterium]